MAPAKPMQLVWAAVTRATAEGPVAGPQHKVPLEFALRAVTIDAAYSIQQEKKVGSIEVGKDANLTVLDQSPYEVAPEKLKDIAVWGTMLEGRLQPVNVKQVPRAAVKKTAAGGTQPAPLAVSSGDEAELAVATVASLTRLLGHKHSD
jgi:hypothetical protein